MTARSVAIRSGTVVGMEVERGGGVSSRGSDLAIARFWPSGCGGGVSKRYRGDYRLAAWKAVSGWWRTVESLPSFNPIMLDGLGDEVEASTAWLPTLSGFATQG